MRGWSMPAAAGEMLRTVPGGSKPVFKMQFEQQSRSNSSAAGWKTVTNPLISNRRSRKSGSWGHLRDAGGLLQSPSEQAGACEPALTVVTVAAFLNTGTPGRTDGVTISLVRNPLGGRALPARTQAQGRGRTPRGGPELSQGSTAAGTIRSKNKGNHV